MAGLKPRHIPGKVSVLFLSVWLWVAVFPKEGSGSLNEVVNVGSGQEVRLVNSPDGAGNWSVDGAPCAPCCHHGMVVCSGHYQQLGTTVNKKHGADDSSSNRRQTLAVTVEDTLMGARLLSAERKIKTDISRTQSHKPTVEYKLESRYPRSITYAYGDSQPYPLFFSPVVHNNGRYEKYSEETETSRLLTQQNPQNLKSDNRINRRDLQLNTGITNSETDLNSPKITQPSPKRDHNNIFHYAPLRVGQLLGSRSEPLMNRNRFVAAAKMGYIFLRPKLNRGTINNFEKVLLPQLYMPRIIEYPEIIKPSMSSSERSLHPKHSQLNITLHKDDEKPKAIFFNLSDTLHSNKHRPMYPFLIPHRASSNKTNIGKDVSTSLLKEFVVGDMGSLNNSNTQQNQQNTSEIVLLQKVFIPDKLISNETLYEFFNSSPTTNNETNVRTDVNASSMKECTIDSQCVFNNTETQRNEYNTSKSAILHLDGGLTTLEENDNIGTSVLSIPSTTENVVSITYKNQLLDNSSFISHGQASILQGNLSEQSIEIPLKNKLPNKSVSPDELPQNVEYKRFQLLPDKDFDIDTSEKEFLFAFKKFFEKPSESLEVSTEIQEHIRNEKPDHDVANQTANSVIRNARSINPTKLNRYDILLTTNSNTGSTSKMVNKGESFQVQPLDETKYRTVSMDHYTLRSKGNRRQTEKYNLENTLFDRDEGHFPQKQDIYKRFARAVDEPRSKRRRLESKVATNKSTGEVVGKQLISRNPRSRLLNNQKVVQDESVDTYRKKGRNTAGRKKHGRKTGTPNGSEVKDRCPGKETGEKEFFSEDSRRKEPRYEQRCSKIEASLLGANETPSLASLISSKQSDEDEAKEFQLSSENIMSVTPELNEYDSYDYQETISTNVPDLIYDSAYDFTHVNHSKEKHVKSNPNVRDKSDSDVGANVLSQNTSNSMNISPQEINRILGGIITRNKIESTKKETSPVSIQYSVTQNYNNTLPTEKITKSYRAQIPSSSGDTTMNTTKNYLRSSFDHVAAHEVTNIAVPSRKVTKSRRNKSPPNNLKANKDEIHRNSSQNVQQRKERRRNKQEITDSRKRNKLSTRNSLNKDRSRTSDSTKHVSKNSEIIESHSGFKKENDITKQRNKKIASQFEKIPTHKKKKIDSNRVRTKTSYVPENLNKNAPVLRSQEKSSRIVMRKRKGNKSGDAHLRLSRGPSREISTTETPRAVTSPASSRSVAVEHRRITKEEFFTRTYIPQGDLVDELVKEGEERAEQLYHGSEEKTNASPSDNERGIIDYTAFNSKYESENVANLTGSLGDSFELEEKLQLGESRNNAPPYESEVEQQTGNKKITKTGKKRRKVVTKFSPNFEYFDTTNDKIMRKQHRMALADTVEETNNDEVKVLDEGIRLQKFIKSPSIVPEKSQRTNMEAGENFRNKFDAQSLVYVVDHETGIGKWVKEQEIQNESNKLFGNRRRLQNARALKKQTEGDTEVNVLQLQGTDQDTAANNHSNGFSVNNSNRSASKTALQDLPITTHRGQTQVILESPGRDSFRSREQQQGNKNSTNNLRNKEDKILCNQLYRDNNESNANCNPHKTRKMINNNGINSSARESRVIHKVKSPTHRSRTASENERTNNSRMSRNHKILRKRKKLTDNRVKEEHDDTGESNESRGRITANVTKETDNSHLKQGENSTLTRKTAHHKRKNRT